jgi:regulator of sigma E protease
LDANANSNPVNPEPNPPPPPPPPSKPHDIAEAGPIDPATGQPDRGAEVSAVKSWFRENAVSLVITAGVIAAVCIWLDPLDTLKVVIGLGLVIFIHELGHFLAAKWCDVHVRTFSIGFGPAVPFCSYKWGETTYMVGIIPLGGYVAMVGENEGAEGEEEGEEDPRSFRKKTVGQRMLIISAGVIMNVILGMACFVAAYLHGVQEKPAALGSVESGSAAWRTGMRTNDHITKIGSREKPFFDDIRPYVMSSGKDELVHIEWQRGSQHFEGKVTPIRDEGQRFPQLGVSPPYQLTLLSVNKRKVKPVYPGTPAAEATSKNGEEKFEPGDRVIAMTDPVTKAVTDVKDYNDYYERMVKLAAEDITFRVKRKDADKTAEIVVKPAYRHDTGMRMQMGEIVAVRAGGPAEGKVNIHSENPTKSGDRIKAVLLPPNAKGERVWYANSVDWSKDEFKVAGVPPEQLQKLVQVQPLDPVLLPHQLNRWADGNPVDWNVELVLLRSAHPTDETVRVTLKFDPEFRFHRETVQSPNSPMPLSGLGLAYWVDTLVDFVEPGGPAEAAGVRKGDQVVAVQFKAPDDTGAMKDGPWKDDLKDQQWASVDYVFQHFSPELNLKVKRGEEVIPVTIKANPNTAFPLYDRGLIFKTEVEVRQAADVGEAIKLGALRTMRDIKTVYMGLYGYINGRISVKTLSGPLTIANVSYRLAGEDFWQFLLFLGMISLNLAVVNFLPIPVLDGGHMVFLILEKILGRPVPERMFAIAMYLGLALILTLMVFVLFLDVGRLFFNMF